MKKSRWLKILIAFLTPIAGVMVCNNSLDNDSWYVLSEGREIVENGIYYEDQLSMHEGLDVTVQNYGFSAIFYLIYSAFGPVGIYLSMLIINLLLCYLIYKVCMLISHKNLNLSLIIMVLTDLLLAKGFIVTRAQLVSYCLIMLVVYLLELYIKNKNSKYLWFLPLISLVQVNLHASLWPMIPLFIWVYIIDSFKCKRLHLEGYKTWPLAVALVGSIIAGFLNPYGFKMLTFIITSYGVPEAHSYINELQSFRPLGDIFNILLYGTIALTMMFYIFGPTKNIRVRWLLLIFGLLALGLNTYKGLSHLILVLLFPLAAVYKDVAIGKKYKKQCWMAASWVGILALTTIIAYSIVMVPMVGERSQKKELVEALDYLDVETAAKNKNELKIYTGYNEGGYVEFRGYKPYIDPRMEVFIKANNGKEDIFQEYYNLENGKLNQPEFLDKYNFDYLIVMDYEKLYNLVSDKYTMIFEKNGEAESVRVYKKLNT